MTDARRPGSAVWLPWVLLAVAVATGLFLLDHDGTKSGAPISRIAATPVAAARKPAEAIRLQPRLQIDSQAGVTSVNGQLAESDRARLATALARTFNADVLKGDIAIDPRIEPATWLDKVVALLPELKAGAVKFAIDGDKAKVDLSRVPMRDRPALSAKIRAAFTGIEVSGLDD